MFYNTVIHIVKFILLILNGRIHVQNNENLPSDRTYVLAAPHRSWLDPVFIAIAAFPHKYTTMAKKELFKNKFADKFLRKMHAFPVDRENPGPSAIKHPVSVLKEGKLNFFIFSTGTRYDSEVKGGTATIARLAKVPIVPVVYQGPFTFGQLISRQKAYVRFAEPIHIPEGRLSKEQMAEIDNQLEKAFETLDKKINPQFKHEYKKK
ncbi:MULTISPECIES: lysophospholipid acyltransferase family protein [unclassified Jeotgalibaca]|uniref:lysophospholipid acyltransferase family protein n=1 Tax=unclassified Jeotgalibaca TaxID=2621505 RepID=UPI003FD018C7